MSADLRGQLQSCHHLANISCNLRVKTILVVGRIPSGEPGSGAGPAVALRRSVRGPSVRRGTKAAADGTKLRGVDIRMAAAYALREVGGKMPYKSARHVLQRDPSRH